MAKDSEIGMKSLHEGVPKPARQDAERVPVAVNLNPSFTFQEMPPVAPDPRGRKGKAVRTKVTDTYVEVTIRRTGGRGRFYYR